MNLILLLNQPIQAGIINCPPVTSGWKHRLDVLQRISAKSFFKWMGRLNANWQPKEIFSIKAGYHHAVKARTFDDTSNTDEWQKEVYEWSASMAREKEYKKIVDVGCGSAFKLIHYLGTFHITGIEISPTYEWLLEKYPEREWLLFDDVNVSQIRADMVICSDVIEHIDNPDDLLDFIDDMDFDILIISTPERDQVAGKNDYGPPENPAHYREWNAVEFKNYLRRWFVVKEQRIFNNKSSTQVVICQKK